MNRFNNSERKSSLHPRNAHRFPYNFTELCKVTPELIPYVYEAGSDSQTIDFANPEGVKMLNKALLKYFYKIEYWDIPPNFLCPPVPGRADYIHNIAELLSQCNNGIIPGGKAINILDTGVGANCIYPIIGIKEYGWSFVGSDINKKALLNCDKLIRSNKILQNVLSCRLQPDKGSIFKGIIKEDEYFDACICNPPFHDSLETAKAETSRKIKNLGKNNENETLLNFGGMAEELFCKGGEKDFIRRMIDESKLFSANCFWFSTLVSKSSNLPSIYSQLNYYKATEVKTIEMKQGQKISRIVAWTFLNKEQQLNWKLKRWK